MENLSQRLLKTIEHISKVREIIKESSNEVHAIRFFFSRLPSSHNQFFDEIFVSTYISITFFDYVLRYPILLDEPRFNSFFSNHEIWLKDLITFFFHFPTPDGEYLIKYYQEYLKNYERLMKRKRVILRFWKSLRLRKRIAAVQLLEKRLPLELIEKILSD